MFKWLFFGLVLLLPLVNQGQIVNVKTHDKVTINTNPKKGEKSFTEWGVFPGKSQEIRRIVLKLTLAHPENQPIAHWDYMDHIKILRQGGIHGINKNIEIARMLTPYGSSFRKGWNFSWQVDITDFQHLLRDSVEIEYIHTGYESPERAWDLSLNFEITYGPQVADFISMEEMWIGNYEYGNPENDIEDHLSPKTISRSSQATFGRFRIQHTGHGMDKKNGCSEFCSRWRELIMDNETVDRRDLWKDCGNNPLYPQGGTWLFDRAYWCPGDLQEPDIIDVPLTNTSYIMDLNMEPYTSEDEKKPNEHIASYFFQYGVPNNQYDVRIEELIAPNNEENYNRFNPRAFDPIIRVRNLGSEVLRSMEIIYGTEGFDKKVYHWQGSLNFYETALITLPGTIESTVGTNLFSVVLTQPNEMQDEWDSDNAMESQFTALPVIPSTFVVDFLTNNKPEHNSIFILNEKKDTVYAKTPESLEPATKHTDTLHLSEDNYHLHLLDSAGDGLEFWYLVKAGYGRLRLMDLYGNMIHTFKSDNGNGQFYAFRTDNQIQLDTSVFNYTVNTFPRVVTDVLTVYTSTNKTSSLELVIKKNGEYIESHKYARIKDVASHLDLRHLDKGVYELEVHLNGERRRAKRFNKR